jgi:hypothetical protein
MVKPSSEIPGKTKAEIVILGISTVVIYKIRVLIIMVNNPNVAKLRGRVTMWSTGLSV